MSYSTRQFMNLAVTAIALFAFCTLGAAGVGIYDVRDFGAKGDGVTKDTAAIQRAVDAASAAGGGEVYFGAGTYLSGSVFLKSNVDFHLSAGAVLKGSPDKEDYNAADVCPQNRTSRKESSFGAHLLLCIEQENVTVRGPGRIDGNSASFLVNPKTGKGWGYDPKCFWKGQSDIPWRPSQMLYFVESRNIRIMDAELANSTYWTLFLHGCEQVSVRGLWIHNERERFHTHNGDGIDIDCSRFVTVSDCRIHTADDCITLRANMTPLKKSRDCAFVTVSNCILSTPCNAVRIGVGAGTVHDATFDNIVVHDARTAVNIVAAWDAKATKGVDFRNIRFSNWVVDCRILLHIYGGSLASGVVRTAELRDIAFTGFIGKASELSMVEWLPNAPARGVSFRDIHVDTSVLVRNVAGLKVEGGCMRIFGKTFSVRDFGAKGDGVTKDTAAIQRAVDAASAAGGGTVELPCGTYLSGPVFLKSHVDFHLANGSVLKGSPDPVDYCAADAFAQNAASKGDNTSGGHLLVAVGCEDVTVRGPGVIDGNAQAFLLDAEGRQHGGDGAKWSWKNKHLVPWRPAQMVFFVDCRNVRLAGAKLVNSPYWSCFILNCDGVAVSDCVIRTERSRFRTWNGDGLDIDRCSNVSVTGCDIDTFDDALTLRASCASRLAKPQDCRNVKVSRCRLSSSCNAVRVGVGEGMIRDCLLSKLDIRNSRKAICLVSAYTPDSRGTDIHDIHFDDIDAACDTFLDIGYRYAKETEIRDITFSNIRGTAKGENLIQKDAARPFKGLLFTNCTIEKGGQTK